MSDFVHELHHHVDLVHGRAVEVLPYCQRELLLGNPPLVFPASHRGGLATDAAGSGQDRLVVGRGKGGGLGEVVSDAVSVQELEGRGLPGHLYA